MLSKILLLCVIGFATGFNGFTTRFNPHREPLIESGDALKSTFNNTMKQRWITQKLDHFNPEDTRKWNMRYLENDRYFKPGGPVFIYIGGEWQISSLSIARGLLVDMTKEHSGMLFYTEHRYYGQSQPTPDTSTENLKYLTVEQALEDLARFIEFIKSADEFESSGVFVVGASYSASVATWARMKYPHLIDGAWASSGPLYAKLNFYEYNEVMTEGIRLIGGEKCLGKFAKAFEMLEGYAAFSEPHVLVKIMEDFSLCEPLKLCRDVPHFFYEMKDTVAGLVQGHQRGDIEDACEFMLDEKHGDAVAALGAWIKSESKDECVDMNYDNMVKKFNNVTWGSEANKQLRQWTYQTCDYFGWFQTGTSENQAFGKTHPQVEYFTKICADFFNNTFTQHSVIKNIERTNRIFRGFDPNVTNVYFTHGQIDPWRVLGLQEDLNRDSPAVVLDRYSHCTDLGSISLSDTAQMRNSKMRVKELVKMWLKL